MHMIGQAAEISGVHIETIRYYERIGLVPNASRAANGRRLYSAADVQRLAFIKRGRDLGFTLEDVRSLLTLTQAGAMSCDDARSLAEHHRADVGGRIDRLTSIAAALDALIEACRDDRSERCAVLAALMGEDED